MSVYTPQIKRQVDSVPIPNDFVMDIVEYDLDPKNPYIGLRFYESHWRHMNDNERLKCIAYMATIKKIFEAYGINTTIDPVYDVPGGQQLK